MNVFLAGLAGAVLLLLVLVLVLMVRMSRMNKRYKKLVGDSQVEHVDELLMELQERKSRLESAVKEQADAIAGIRRVMHKMKANVAVSRYNAFAQQGSDLSFSIAILDGDLDGVVLTSIHSREDSYVYAKPVEKGASSYALSPEEKEVIARSAAAAKPEGSRS